MNNDDMIIWFIKQIGFSHQDVAEMLTAHSDELRNFTSKQVKQMMLKRTEWPFDTWNVLRCMTSQKIARVQRQVNLINEISPQEYKVKKAELTSPLDRLGVIMACILLSDDTPVILA